MTDYVLPVGWKYYGSSNENQTTFIGPGHTVSAPYLAIFSRVVPQSQGGGVSYPKYRIRIIRGRVDELGNPVQKRAVIDVNINWDVAFDNAVVSEMMGTLGAMLSSAALQDDVVVEHLLPRNVAPS